MDKKRKNILIIGICGGLAQIVARLLSKNEDNLRIVGVDSRSITSLPAIPQVEYKKIRYSRNDFENLFRSLKFDCVYHLGRISHARANPRASLAKRLDLNVIGTNRILELATQHQVRRVIVLSTWHVYGAYPDNPVFIKETNLLRASIKHPDLRDVVEMDQLTTNWMWKYQHEIDILLFRPCSIVGPNIRNSMTNYLKSEYMPLGHDYNPMMQFIHEYDMSHILSFAKDNMPIGTYNVAPNEYVSLHEAKSIIGKKTLPSSIFVIEKLANALNKSSLFSVPNYLLDYLKYPCLVSNDELMRHISPKFFRFSTQDTLELLNLKA